MKPGTTLRPSSAITSVSGPILRAISSSLPMAVMSPSRMARARTSGTEAERVLIGPPVSTLSAAGVCEQWACPVRRPRPIVMRVVAAWRVCMPVMRMIRP